MKTRKIISILIAPLVIIAITIGCDNQDDAITTSMNDVSSRITGFGSDVTGAGAELTINGSRMDEVVRIAMYQYNEAGAIIGNSTVASRLFTDVSESSISFAVPLNVALGETEVMVVYPGPDRAFANIEVIPFQAVTSFTPYSAATGETVTIYGANLEIVDELKLGTVDATITSQSPGMIQFTVPDGITTGKITLISEAGSAFSGTDLTSCTASPTASDCPAGLNLNTSFEDGAGDVFTNWTKANGGTLMTSTTVPSERFRGARGVKVARSGTLGSGQWRIQLVADAIATDPGASYSVYLWVRASAAGGAMRVSTNPGGPSDQYTADQNVTTAWQRLVFTFPTITLASTRFSLDMNGNDTAATTFYVDDVKVIKN